MRRLLGRRMGQLARRGTLTRRVLISAVAVLILLVALGWILVGTAGQLRRTQLRQADTFTPAAESSTALLAAFVDQETGLRGFLLTGDRSFLAPYQSAESVITAELAELAPLVGEVPNGGARLAEVHAAYDSWSGYARDLLRRVEAGDRAGATDQVATGTGKQRFDQLRTATGELSRALSARAHANARAITEAEHRLVVVLVIALTALTGVVVIGTWALLRAVIDPVHHLAVAARRVADGNLSAPIELRGALEIRSMAEDVRAMRDRLTADADAARKALEAVAQQGPTVSALRRALLPSSAEVAGVRTAGRLEPAEGVLGGDWYDLIQLSPSRLAVVIGDTAGHGPHSAVLALRLKHALVAALRSSATPAQALAIANRTLQDVPAELFATALVLTLDTGTDELTYANAGHPPALLHPAADPSDRRRSTAAPQDGPPAGWEELDPTGPLLSPLGADWTWAEVTRSFEPGDTLIAFTDGLLEARDAAGEQFGAATLHRALGALDLGNGPRLLEALTAAVLRHLGDDRRDDLTMVYARRVAGSG